MGGALVVINLHPFFTPKHNLTLIYKTPAPSALTFLQLHTKILEMYAIKNNWQREKLKKNRFYLI
jgi:hypothetical protein